MSKLCSVSTTIQPPTPAVRRLCRALRRVASQLLVLGDRKGLAAYSLAGAEFFALDRQLALPLRLPQLLPVNHYSRKNLGYLVAISRAAECIYETDDDNAPSAGWQLRNRTVRARKVNGLRWCNVIAISATTSSGRAGFHWTESPPPERRCRPPAPRVRSSVPFSRDWRTAARMSMPFGGWCWAGRFGFSPGPASR